MSLADRRLSILIPWRRVILLWLVLSAAILGACRADVAVAPLDRESSSGFTGHALRADAPPDDGLGPIGQLGGSAAAVAVRGDTAFVGVGRRVLIVDVSGAQTRELGQSPDLGDTVRAIALHGDVAWLAVGQAGLVALDVRRLERMAEIGRMETSWAVYDVALDTRSSLAYVAEGARGLRIIDVAEPAAPRELGRLDTPGEARAVAFSAGRVFVADWGTGVSVIDVSRPAAPRVLASIAMGEASDVALAADRLVIAERARGLVVVDVGDPTAPVWLGELSLEGTAERVALAADASVAWVAAREGGLRLVDLAQPASPRELAALATTTIAWDVALNDDGTRAFVADVGAYSPAQPGIGGGSWEAGHVWGVEAQAPQAYGFSGLRLVEWQGGGALVELAVHLSPGFVEGVARVGERLLLADGYAGLVLADVRDPARPRLGGSLPTTGAAHAVAIVGDTAYLADGPAGVAAIDLDALADLGPGQAGLASRVLLWRLDTPGEALGVAYDRGLLYVADGESGLRVIDVRGPSEVTTVPLPGYAWDVTIHAGFAWVAARNGGLRVLSLADPRAPVEVSSLLSEQSVVFQTVMADDRAWVAAGPSGLVLLDIADPHQPRELTRLALEGTVVGLALDEALEHAYVAAGRGGLAAVDISRPGAPRIERQWALPGVAERVMLQDGVAFVATERGGLQLLRVRPERRPSDPREWLALPWGIR